MGQRRCGWAVCMIALVGMLVVGMLVQANDLLEPLRTDVI